MVLKSKWGRIQPEIQPSSDREQDVSRKPLEVSRDALRDEITYDSLLAHSALQCGKVKKVVEGQYFQYSTAVTICMFWEDLGRCGDKR